MTRKAAVAASKLARSRAPLPLISKTRWLSTVVEAELKIDRLPSSALRPPAPTISSPSLPATPAGQEQKQAQQQQTIQQDEARQQRARQILREAVSATAPRTNWTRQEIAAIYYQPLLELTYQAVGASDFSHLSPLHLSLQT